MKFNMIAFICIALALTSLIERTKAQKEKVENLTLMDVIQNILNEPEFLALSARQQLDVLLVMYTILDNHLKRSKDMKKRDINVRN